MLWSVQEWAHNMKAMGKIRCAHRVRVKVSATVGLMAIDVLRSHYVILTATGL